MTTSCSLVPLNPPISDRLAPTPPGPACLPGSIVDALSAHIAILDDQGTIIEVNAAWKRFACENGLAGDRHGVGENYLAVCDAASGEFSEEASAMAAGIRGVVTGKHEEFHLEQPCHGPEELRWFIGRATRLAEGGVVRIVVAHENITVRKQAEEALRASERRLQMALQAGGLGVFEHIPHDDRLIVSREFCQIVGLPLQTSASHEEWVRRIHPDDRSQVLAGVQRMLAERSALDLEYRLCLPEGEVRWIRATASPVAERGKRERVYGVVQDITKRKDAEAGLRWLSRAVEHSPVSIIITDLEGRIDYVNPRFCTTTGYGFEEVKGKHPRILESGEMPTEIYRQMWETLAAGREWRGEFHNRKKSGELYWETASISPVCDDKGAITHYVAVKVDVTESKRAAQQQAERKESEERSRRALEHQHVLRQRHFVAMVSHEFRTPLGVINTAAHLLGRYTDRMSVEDRAAQIAEIKGSVARMTLLMEDLLIHGEFEAGSAEYRPVHVDVEALCRQVLSDTSKNFGESCMIDCRIAPLAREAFVDGKILRHIVGNLLSNAVKYSFPGQPVAFDVRRVAGNEPIDADMEISTDDHLQLTVTDSGIGIPAADLARLFESFHRATNVGERPGTGMGLAIVKKCVDLHCGTVRIDSTLGKGTSVQVRLPIARPDHSAPTRKNS